jgi:hypothetical protein
VHAGRPRDLQLSQGQRPGKTVGALHRLLFERFDKLKQPSFHPKWKDINITATVPGWNRYWLAEEKLATMQRTAGAIPDSLDKEALFEKLQGRQKQQDRKQ